MGKKILVIVSFATGLALLPPAVVAGQGGTPYLASISTLAAGEPGEDNGCGAASDVTVEADSFYLAEQPTSVLSAMTTDCGLLWFECSADACHQMGAEEAARKYGVGGAK